jgi:hypothetical protein
MSARTVNEWAYAEITHQEMSVTNPDDTKSPIIQETVTDSKKTLGIHDSPAGGSADHLSYIKDKASVWVQRMQNGLLPHHIAWTAYRLQLWPGLRYGLGTMTNDIEPAKELLHAEDYKTLNVLGVLRNVTKGLRRLHTTFGGFGLLSPPTEQLISQVNMLMQHYHASTNLGRKLDASLRYLQLQLGTPHNPLTLDYAKWGQLAPLSWVKMLWRLLHHFDIHLHMDFSTIPLPRERDQVLMDIFFKEDLSRETIRIFLSDVTTADGRYLKKFVFEPGSKNTKSKFKFPCKKTSNKDWNLWFNFWHNFTSTGDKLKVPLGNWIHPTHRV